MGDGNYYATKLSEKEFVDGLDNILKVIKEDYNSLWEGNPSLISKYTDFDVDDFKVDSGKQLMIESDLAGCYPSGFSTLGVVRKNHMFAFYLEGFEKKSLITNSHTVYKNLRNQFDLSTKACFNDWTENLKENIKEILEKDLEEKIELLESKIN